MPDTEAGKRLLENGDAYTYTRAVLADQIAAIEAEAREQAASVARMLLGEANPTVPGAIIRSVTDRMEAGIVAAERARIRAAVEGLPLAWDSEETLEDGRVIVRRLINRAAVLRIVEGGEQ